MLRTGQHAFRIEQRAIATLLASPAARAAAAPRLRSSHPRAHQSLLPQRRAFSSTLPVRSDASSSVAEQAAAIEEASPGFMEAAVAKLEPLAVMLQDLPSLLHLSGSPYAYALSIVALTYVLRSTFTLPAVLWQRGRNDRLQRQVLPAWQELKATLPQKVAVQCRRAGLSYEEFEVKMQAELKAALKKLMKEHRCSPMFTLLAPSLGIHIPLFLLVSQVIRLAAGMPGSGLGNEVIAWWTPLESLVKQFEEGAKLLAARGMEGEALQRLTMPMGPTLSETDRTMMSPVVLGLLMLSNTELTQWLRRATGADEAQAKLNAKAKQGEMSAVEKAEFMAEESVEPIKTKAIGNTLRGLSIMFVIFSSQAPSAVVIYWISSFSYTLIQNSILAVIDRRRTVNAIQHVGPVSSLKPKVDAAQAQVQSDKRRKALLVRQSRDKAQWSGEVGTSAPKGAPTARARVGVAGQAADQMDQRKLGFAERAQAELDKRRGGK